MFTFNICKYNTFFINQRFYPSFLWFALLPQQLISDDTVY